MKNALRLLTFAILVIIVATEGLAHGLMFLGITLGLELWDLVDKINEVIKNPDIRVMRLEAEIERLQKEEE